MREGSRRRIGRCGRRCGHRDGRSLTIAVSDAHRRLRLVARARPLATATWRLSIAGIASMPFGLLALTNASRHALTILIAVVPLVLVVVMARPPRLLTGPRAEVGAGFGAGFGAGGLETSTGMHGPPMVLALQGSRWLPDGDPTRSAPTLQVAFWVQVLVALAAVLAVDHRHVDYLPWHWPVWSPRRWGGASATGPSTALGGSVPLGRAGWSHRHRCRRSGQRPGRERRHRR